MVQEAFIRLAGSNHLISDPTKTAAYLRSIVLNIARDHNRRGRLFSLHAPDAPELDPAEVDETVAMRADHQHLLVALLALSQRQRECVALHYLLELSVVEISVALGLSPNSVKTHLKRGLAALRLHPRMVASGA